MTKSLSFTDVGFLQIFNMPNTSFNAIRKKEILRKSSEFTVVIREKLKWPFVRVCYRTPFLPSETLYCGLEQDTLYSAQYWFNSGNVPTGLKNN